MEFSRNILLLIVACVSFNAQIKSLLLLYLSQHKSNANTKNTFLSRTLPLDRSMHRLVLTENERFYFASHLAMVFFILCVSVELDSRPNTALVSSVFGFVFGRYLCRSSFIIVPSVFLLISVSLVCFFSGVCFAVAFALFHLLITSTNKALRPKEQTNSLRFFFRFVSIFFSRDEATFSQHLECTKILFYLTI